MNPEFDRRFLKVKTLADGPEKLALIHEMRGIIEQEVPWIPLFHPEDYTLFHGWEKNVKTSGLSVPTAKYHDVDAELRAARRRSWNKPVLWPAAAFCLLAVVLFIPGLRTYMRERR
jgi:hypothetical protein